MEDTKIMRSKAKIKRGTQEAKDIPINRIRIKTKEGRKVVQGGRGRERGGRGRGGKGGRGD